MVLWFRATTSKGLTTFIMARALHTAMISIYAQAIHFIKLSPSARLDSQFKYDSSVKSLIHARAPNSDLSPLLFDSQFKGDGSESYLYCFGVVPLEWFKYKKCGPYDPKLSKENVERP